jgi:tetratricopeptide (TPR) repeat protein
VALIGDLRKKARPADPWQAESLAALLVEISENAAEKPPEVVELYRDVVGVVQTLLEKYADSPDAVDVAATLYKRFGHVEEADACWQQCLELNPGFGDAHYRLGLLARDRADNAAAAEHFRKAIELKTSVAGIADPLAWALIDLGRIEEAIEVLRQDLIAHPRSAATLMLLGQAYLRAKDYPKAKESFEASIALAPDLSFAYPGLATAYAKLGQKEKAAMYAGRYTAFRTKKEQKDRQETRDEKRDARYLVAFVRVAAGKAYYAQGDAQTAQEIWGRAAELSPESTEPLLLLAWSHEQQGRFDEAAKALTALCQSHPDELEPQLQLVQLHLRQGRTAQAEASLRRIIERGPKRAEPYSILANLLLQRGKDAEARRMAAKAADLEPIALNHSLVALACWRCGDQAAAVAAIDRALAAEPDNPRYRGISEVIRKESSPPSAPTLPRLPPLEPLPSKALR